MDDAWKRGWLIATFAATLGIAGFLLGTLLPIVGRLLIPRFDDLRHSWNVCLVCLLSTVFLGYVYAHFVVKLPLKLQFVVHAAALGLALLTLLPTPLDIGRLDLFGWNPFQGGPILIVALLAVTVAVPLLPAAATTPLVQRWFSFTAHPAAADPYFLYGATLLGQSCGMLAYSFVIEPFVSLTYQLWVWTGGFFILVLLTAVCAVLTWRFRAHGPAMPLVAGRVGQAFGERREANEQQQFENAVKRIALAPSETDRPTIGVRLCWIGLPLVTALSGVLLEAFLEWTRGRVTELNPFPLLWLVQTVLCQLAGAFAFLRWPFSGTRVALRIGLALWPILLVCCFISNALGTAGFIVLTFAIPAATGLVSFGLLATLRPQVAHLTEFYLLFEAGQLLIVPMSLLNWS